MKCPVCTTPELVMSERQGIEIDYCPQCRGVWLDRGELDKIIERSGQDLARASAATPAPAVAAPGQQPIPPQPYDRDHHRGGSDDDYYKRKRRKSFLEELFD
jgi:Zn-finger nucleic acid-binding protein